MATPNLFHERRIVPWWWWIVGTAIAVPTMEAVVVLGPEMSRRPTVFLAVSCFVGTVLVVAGCLVLLGRSDVDLGPDGLRAGRAMLPADHVGRSRTLDAAAARRLLGPGIRADAGLSLRPWIKTAIQIEVANDPSTPYWVVATRRPAELVAALDVMRAGLLPDNLDQKAEL
jgi:Protein of unknown function (DUF3093)